MRRIMFLYNSKEREMGIIELISRQIKKYDKNTEIFTEQFYDGLFQCMHIKPHVIVTIPPRDNYSANYLLGLKIITNALIISMTTEGYFSYDEVDVRQCIGDNYYSESLIDFNIMWGEKTKAIFGEKLLKDEKISERRRLISAGYAFYEIDKAQEYYTRFLVPEDFIKFKTTYHKIVLVLSGFLSKDMTVEEAFLGGYFGSSKRRSEIDGEDRKLVRNINLLETEFSRKYIGDIEKAAIANGDMGFIIKLHPMEIAKNPNLYKELERYENILVINTTIPLGHIIKWADVMVHYNSTSAFEAYIYGIPSVQRYDLKSKRLNCLVWQWKGAANYYFDIDDSKEFVDFISTDIPFAENLQIEGQLLDYFNWRKDRPYKPIETIAKTILSKEKAQRLRWDDKRNAEAVCSNEVSKLKRVLLKNLLEDMVNGSWLLFLSQLADYLKLEIFKLCAVGNYKRR